MRAFSGLSSSKEIWGPSKIHSSIRIFNRPQIPINPYNPVREVIAPRHFKPDIILDQIRCYFSVGLLDLLYSC